MKVFRYLFDSVLTPLIAALLTPTVLGFASKIKTGGWFNLLRHISPTLWGVFGTFIFLCSVAVLIRVRLKEVRKWNEHLEPLVSHSPLFGWKTVMKVRYAGVIRIVKAPVSEPYPYFNPLKVPALALRVVIPPGCPKCGTELEESFSFWGWYSWKCVGCGFKRRSREDFYKESARAGRIARREWEVRYSKGRYG